MSNQTLANELATRFSWNQDVLDELLLDIFGDRAADQNNAADGDAVSDDAAHADQARLASLINQEGLEAQLAFLLDEGWDETSLMAYVDSPVNDTPAP